MMKEHLLHLYRDLCSKATRLPPSLIARLGCPFFTFPRDRWGQAMQRILIVGQEPFEWGFQAGLHYSWPHPPLWSLAEVLSYDRSVEALTYAYVAHMYELKSPYRPTPFTRAFDLLISAVSREAVGDVLSTNLFKCTLQVEGRPHSRSPLNAATQDLEHVLDWQRGCLRREIEILSPTAVVFLTGPRYDCILTDEFAGARLEPVGQHTAQQFAKVVHPTLPKRSFRIYHPGYLARTGRWAWLNELTEEVSRSDALAV